MGAEEPKIKLHGHRAQLCKKKEISNNCLEIALTVSASSELSADWGI